MMKTKLVLICATLIACNTHAQTPTNPSARTQAAAAVQPQSIEITESSVFQVHLEAAREVTLFTDSSKRFAHHLDLIQAVA